MRTEEIFHYSDRKMKTKTKPFISIISARERTRYTGADSSSFVVVDVLFFVVATVGQKIGMLRNNCASPYLIVRNTLQRYQSTNLQIK